VRLKAIAYFGGEFAKFAVVQTFV